MSVTFEQVEKLKDRANVTWEEAKSALESAGGDLLEAMLLLERQGKIPPPQGGFYTTRAGAEGQSLPAQRAQSSRKDGEDRWKARVREFLEAAVGILRHCTVHQREVWRGGQMMASIPVLIVILLFVVAFWVCVPLMVVGLVFGCRYTFSGPDLHAKRVNEAIDCAARTVQDTAARIKDEFSNQHKK